MVLLNLIVDLIIEFYTVKRRYRRQWLNIDLHPHCFYSTSIQARNKINIKITIQIILGISILFLRSSTLRCVLILCFYFHACYRRYIVQVISIVAVWRELTLDFQRIYCSCEFTRWPKTVIVLACLPRTLPLRGVFNHSFKFIHSSFSLLFQSNTHFLPFETLISTAVSSLFAACSLFQMLREIVLYLCLLLSSSNAIFSLDLISFGYV